MSHQQIAQDGLDLDLINMEDIAEEMEVDMSARKAANDPESDKRHKVRWKIEEIIEWRRRSEELGLPYEDLALEID